MNKFQTSKAVSVLLLLSLFSLPSFCQLNVSGTAIRGEDHFMIGVMFFILAVILIAAVILQIKLSERVAKSKMDDTKNENSRMEQYIESMDIKQMDQLLKYKKIHEPFRNSDSKIKILTTTLLIALFSLYSNGLFAQSAPNSSKNLMNNPGVIITIILILTPILGGIFLLIIQVRNVLKQQKIKRNTEEAQKLANYIDLLPADKIDDTLRKRKDALEYKIPYKALSGISKANDPIGLIHVIYESTLPVVAIKKKAVKRPNIDPQLSKLVLWYLGAATFWLVVGTTVGEYLGI